MNYNDRIRALREDNDLTQLSIANHLNIAQNTYSQYESRKREIPLSILIKLADFYNCSLDFLVGRTDKKEINQ